MNRPQLAVRLCLLAGWLDTVQHGELCSRVVAQHTLFQHSLSQHLSLWDHTATRGQFPVSERSTQFSAAAALVRRTLLGCMRLRGQPTVRKCALTLDDLQTVINHYQRSSSHDDLLFVAMLVTGFFRVVAAW